MTRLVAALAACAALMVACDRGETCRGGSVACGGVCVRLETDGQHCGACGNACGAGRVCSVGACALTCAASLATCTVAGQPACVDVRNDPANCGGCGVACPGGQVCSAGACGPACAAPLATCGPGPAAYCADLRADPANCGGCGVACPGGQVCSAGACGPACAAPLATCGQGPAAYCADLRADPANCGACGARCAAGEACVAGACAPTCAGAGGTLCGGGCVDLATDDAHCGACGHACGEGTACRGGACAATCPPPQIPCHGACLDPRADVANCGACGHVCQAGAVCREGACAAPACTGPVGLPAPAFGALRAPGWGVYGSALADLDGDGALELAVANFYGAAIEVRRVLPGGAFDAGAVTTLAASPECLAAGDLDGDGDVDLVTALPGVGAIAVLRNDGGGRFAVTPAPSAPFEHCALGDLDGDGRPDLVATSFHSDRVWVAVNDGRGAFAPAVSYPSGRPGPEAVVVVDLDGDGRLDVVVANSHHTVNWSAAAIDNGSISVYRGAADGTLGAPATFAVGDLPSGLAVADLTGDGVLDVLVSRGLGEDLGLLAGDGAGGLLPLVPIGGAGRVREVATADLDGDGLVDVLVDLDWEETQVLWNLGHGSFSPSVPYVGEGRMHAADVTGDGVADVVLASESPHVLVQEGPRQLAAAARVVDGNGGARILLADMDGDGRVDLVAATGAAIAIGRGNGDGTFQPPVLVPTLESAFLAVGDLDGDGLPELVHAGNVAQLRRNRGGLAFGPEEPLSAAQRPWPELLDVDDDGDLDLVLVYEGTALGFWDAPVEVRLNDGRGGLGPPRSLPRSSTILSGDDRGAAVGDLDGDGIPDLVVSASYRDVTVYRGLGHGAFDPAYTTLAIQFPSPPVVLDVTGDGIADLVVASSYPRFELRIYPGGPGGPGAPTVLPVTVAPLHVLAVDVDSDGRRDVVVGGNGLAVLRALPGGGLAPAAIYAHGYRPGIAAADLDGDLRPEVVLGLRPEDGGGYAVLVNRCLP